MSRGGHLDSSIKARHESRRVSIGVSCYNAETTIVRALNSAFAQEVIDAEYVVIDDASCDSSRERIEGLVGSSPRVRLHFRETNGRLAAVMNDMLDLSMGYYLAFFDDDDESLPRRVANQVLAIELHISSHDDCLERVLCFASREVIFPDGRTEFSPAVGSSIFPAASRPETILAYALYETGNLRKERSFGSGTLVSTALAVRELGGFDESFSRAADTDLVVRAARAGMCVVGHPAALVRQHKSDAPDKLPSTALKARLQLLDKHSDLYTPRTLRAHKRYLSFKYNLLSRRPTFALKDFVGAFFCDPARTLVRLYMQVLPRAAARRRTSGAADSRVPTVE